MDDSEKWKRAQEKEHRHWEGDVKNMAHPPRLLSDLAYYSTAFEFALPEIGRRKIASALEVGVGPASIGTLPFITPGAAITGVDPLPSMPFRCSDSLLDTYAQSLKAKVTYQQVKGEGLPFANDTFDLVVSVNVLDHTDNPSAIMDQMFRVLKPGGLYLLAVNTLSVAGRVKFETWRRLQPTKDIFVMHPFSYQHRDLKRELEARRLRILMEVGPHKPFLGKSILSKFVAEKRTAGA